MNGEQVGWWPAQKLRCQVTRLIDHGGRVYTVDLRPTSAPASIRSVLPGVGQYDPVLARITESFSPARPLKERRVSLFGARPLHRTHGAWLVEVAESGSTAL
jgi:hypothetical protein